ncbi:hypothetical protein ABZ348_31460 [Streptomyces sp. NPDC005963]|uniref:hypothetical protein n=1 Tax=Streptomyces sp. NPDC005963 TaxID=3156721 RepID=UPI003402DD87
MKLRITVHQARIGPQEFTVIRPAGRLLHAVLIDHDRHLGAYLDEEAARYIGGLWTLAATSPRSLIHLPLRGNPNPARPLGAPGTRQLDLVLLHRSLPFAPSHWQEVNGRLDPGRVQTVTLASSGAASPLPMGRRSRRSRENGDHIHQHLQAETLFLGGSATTFRASARHFLDVASQGPGRSDDRHHLPPAPRPEGALLGPGRELRLEHRDAWQPSGDRQAPCHS